MPCASFIPSHESAAYKTWAANRFKVKIARRSATNTLFTASRVSWSSLNILPLCSATRLPPKEEEARGFASPPHNGFAFIVESTPRGDAPAHVQVGTTVDYGSSSPGCLEGWFLETQLPVMWVLGNLERKKRTEALNPGPTIAH